MGVFNISDDNLINNTDIEDKNQQTYAILISIF